MLFGLPNFGPLFSNLYSEQIIAPFLVTLRVANRATLTSGTIVSGTIDSIHFTGSNREPPGGDTTASVDSHEVTPSGLGVGTSLDEVPL